MMHQHNTQNRVAFFFAYVRSLGITEQICNMALAIGRYMNLLAVYDKTIESDSGYLNRLQKNSIECVDVSELRKVIDARFKSLPILFHCQGFSHLSRATKVARPIDKVMFSVHCFRHGLNMPKNLWYAKWFAFLSYCLFFRSVDMWHFLCSKSRDEYFWFRKIPSNTFVFPLGVEEMFMTKTTEPCVVRDIDGEEIADLSDKVNIVYIARFEPWKRHFFLLRSLRSILNENTYLILLGEGSLLDKVMDLARELGIRDHVVFTGRVERETVHHILAHTNLAVTASTSETFGWCLLEPFCMDVPIVTTNVGIANSIIYDFHNGFILKKNCKEEEFLEKTKMALKHFKKIDNSDKKSLYLWETFGKNTVRCYDSLFETENRD